MNRFWEIIDSLNKEEKKEHVNYIISGTNLEVYDGMFNQKAM